MAKIGYARTARTLDRRPRGLIFSAFGIEISWDLLKEPLRCDQQLPSNLLKTDFQLKMAIHKCLA